MKLRRITIKHFRGIDNLDWRLGESFACLVGPGDSTKTAILDAIGFVLSSRYNLSFTDADFHNCDTLKPIIIDAAVVDLPDALVEESAHGKNQSGIREDGSYEHDPLDEDGVEACLIVRLTVDETLEPVWEVVRPGEESGFRITAAERARLGFFRIGDSADSHLRWSRGSALTGLTASKTEATYAVVDAQRRARAAVAGLNGTPLHQAAEIAQEIAVRLGSAAFSDLRPGLDPGMTASTASLVLHDGNVPLTYFGLGSRRLTSLAIQQNATAERSIIAIDEIEHGLDPHRLLHLVRHLRSRTGSGDLQVLVTTHSPTVIETLATDELFVVRSVAGTTSVTPVPPELSGSDLDTTQGLIRSRPSTLLARRVIVGEGATETGLLRHLLGVWDQERKDPDVLTAVTAGVTVTNGGGDSQAPARAAALARLGYPTLLLLDGDVTSNAAAVQTAKDAGVEVVQWPAGDALEDVIVDALPTDALQQLVELASAESSEEGVLASVQRHVGEQSLTTSLVSDWLELYDDPTVRSAIAAAAKGKKHEKKDDSRAWFKREDRGERLAAFLVSVRNELAKSELAGGLGQVKKFAYHDAPEPVMAKAAAATSGLAG